MNADQQAQVTRYTEEARGRMIDIRDRLDRAKGRLAKALEQDYPQGILDEAATVHGLAKDYKKACDTHRNWQCTPQVMLRKELALLR